MGVHRIERRTGDDFAKHVAVETAARSFSMFGHTVCRVYIAELMKEKVRYFPDGFDSFQLTWIPGSVMLTGDHGNLTISGRSQLETFDGAIAWLAVCSYDYLMGKTEVKKEYCSKATAEWIIEEANRELVQEFGELFRPDEDGKDPYPEVIGRIALDRNHPAHFLTGLETWDIPLCWLEWTRLWNATQHLVTIPTGKLQGLDYEPSMVMKSWCRKAIKEAIEDLAANQHELSEFVSDELGDDDYCGTYVYPSRTRFQIEAIQAGCKILMDRTAIERAA